MASSYDVFVSYARDATDSAAAIDRELSHRGLRVFSDQSMVPGGGISSALQKAMSDSRVILLLLSPAAARSEWMRHEVAYAVRKQTGVVPVLLDRAALDSPIGTLLGDRVIVDVSDMSPDAVAVEVARHLDKQIFTVANQRRLRRRVFIATSLAFGTVILLSTAVAWQARMKAGAALVVLQQAELKAKSLDAQLEFSRDQLRRSREATRYVKDGIELYQRHQYAQAVMSYDLALDLDPGNAYVYDLKGYSLFKLKQLPLAIESLQKAVHSDPKYAWGYFNLARAYCSAEQYAPARDAIGSALRLRPDLKVTMNQDGEFVRVCRAIRASFQ